MWLSVSKDGCIKLSYPMCSFALWLPTTLNGRHSLCLYFVIIILPHYLIYQFTWLLECKFHVGKGHICVGHLCMPSAQRKLSEQVNE